MGQRQNTYLPYAVPSTLSVSLGEEESGLNHRMTVCTHVFKCSEAKGTDFEGNSVFAISCLSLEQRRQLFVR